MKFKFDANQEFQVDAIAAAADLFKGQPRIEMNLAALMQGPLFAVSNRLDINLDVLLNNLRTVQERNGLSQDQDFRFIEEAIDTATGEERVRFPNFSIEMETGTGKTYVYLRTALELFYRYGMRKFIIIIPSVAIREGVLKTLEMTRAHFRALYNNLPYHYYPYDSGNLARVRQFALSNTVELMVMTLASFNKDVNVIRQTTDRLQGETPLHLLQASRPILIIDEPQNMESGRSIQALASLNPLFALRYSATHTNPYNMLYRVTPYEAYRQGLVKRIEVAGVQNVNNVNVPYIYVEEIRSHGNSVSARLRVHKRLRTGQVKEVKVTVRPDDSLEAKTNRSDYGDFTIEEINLAEDFVLFRNGIELHRGESLGEDRGAIWEAQMRYTIEQHFAKQRRRQDDEVKVLSLFFIDRVGNYADQNGQIRQLFNRLFCEVAARHPELCKDLWGTENVDPETVQAAYFAQHRTRAGQIILEDSATGEAEKDREVYDLIMKDKERLLSFQEPVAFIFTHSALREGWDNPNVFQICTLNQTVSEMRKRQEIGRGVRLAVNQSGDRLRDERINVLTVVANESYEQYVARLQSEYDEQYPRSGDRPPIPASARKRKTATLRKRYLLKPEFKELWERIKHKTRYAVKVNTGRLIQHVVSQLDEATIHRPQIAVIKAQVNITEDEALEGLQLSGARTLVDLAGRYPLPNLITLMQELLERTTPPVRLSAQTLFEIYRQTRSKQAALDNPHEFANVATHIIKASLADQLVDGIQYERIDEWYEMTQFETDIESWEAYLEPAEKSLYDHVLTESDVERQFVHDLEHRFDVRLYIKLPSWFTVPTPIGEYNPDWAIVMEDPENAETGKPLLYLVRETKGSRNPDDWHPDERRKVKCGERHFKEGLGVDYKVVTVAQELP